MEEKEIRARYKARKCKNQQEFDCLMQQMNVEQTSINHPYLDRDRELLTKIELLKQQRDAIHIQMQALRVERLELEQKRKDINRVFHELKHDLIMENPKDSFVVVGGGYFRIAA